MSEITKFEHQKEDQIKCIQSLIEKKVYEQPIVEEIKCPHCGTLFTRRYTDINKLKAPLKHGYCSKECYVSSGEFARQRAIGQQKRIKVLKEKGTYHVPQEISVICKECGKEYSYDKEKPHLTQYLILGYCSDNCYSKSGKKIIQKYKTELNKCGIDCNNKTDDEIKVLFSAHMSNRTKKSVDKWRSTHYERYIKNNENYFSERSKRGEKTKQNDFLIKNNILSESEIDNISEEEKQFLYKQYFNKKTKHGEKCIAGRLKKHGNSIVNYKESYYKGIKKRIHNFLLKYYTIEELDNLSDEEFCTIYNDAYQLLYIESKKGVKSSKELRKWKLSHLIKNGYINTYDEISNINDDEINKLYSEYISSRIKILSPSYGGFKKTLKGWYVFFNNIIFFYRSSWELKVCEVLNEIFEDVLDNVEPPEPIPYEWENKKHHYFPDIKIKYKNGKVIIVEIKPLRRTLDDINLTKFEAAKKMYGDNFVILTENEIYSDNFKNLLISYGK